MLAQNNPAINQWNQVLLNIVSLMIYYSGLCCLSPGQIVQLLIWGWPWLDHFVKDAIPYLVHFQLSKEAALAFVEEVIAQEVVPTTRWASRLACHLVILINNWVSLGLNSGIILPPKSPNFIRTLVL